MGGFVYSATKAQRHKYYHSQFTIHDLVWCLCVTSINSVHRLVAIGVLVKQLKTALLVIDCQNYFFDPASPAYLPASKRILPRVNKLIALAHDHKWPVVFTIHGPSYSSRNLMLSKWRHLPKGRQCELHQDLKVPNKAKIMHKQYYSAFIGTRLEEFLKKRGISRLVLCGAMTHLCVDTTVRHAFMLGFKPVIVRDACCSKSPALHRAALLALGHGFAKIISTKEITTGNLSAD